MSAAATALEALRPETPQSVVEKLEHLVKHELPRFYEQAFRHLGNWHDAEDAVQDALVSARVSISKPSCCALANTGLWNRSEQVAQAHVKSPLAMTIEHFDVTDAVFRDGVSELSLKKIDDLHLGFEEIIRDKIEQDPRALSPHFTLHLQGRTVRDILGELCKTDPRYSSAQDGATVNIYPRAIAGDGSYLLNLHIDRIVVGDASDADHALTPLFKQFPEQQIGYFGPGLGSNTYDEPWTAVFDSLTVRQFINRIAEHMGTKTSWVWEGGKKERMFTFLKDGFNTFRPNERKLTQ